MSEKRSIVITTIFPPTEAVRKFVALKSWDLIVVGDRKTPSDWQCGDARFVSAEQQTKSGLRLAKLLPWNHYCRKLVGYVLANASGATVIADTDDDNIPMDTWKFPPFDSEYLTDSGQRGFVNVYTYFTGQFIWPRGLPLNKVKDPAARVSAEQLSKRPARVGVWQGLADDDPDVDAIYRLTLDTPCVFDQRDPIVLAPGTYSPFNSQNTLFHRELFPLLYLPGTVTFRFTDILRGLVALPIMEAAGFSLGFTSSTVRQLRNPHNYMKDFESEVPMYLDIERSIAAARGALVTGSSVADNLHRAYTALEKLGITQPAEMAILDAWLADLDLQR